MELVRRLDERYARLRQACSGRRVGVYPGVQGRFVNDLGRRLAGFDVVGLHRPHPGVRDQGLPVIESPGAFLETVDTVLAWGLDQGAEEMLRHLRAHPSPPELIDVLDPDHPLSLTRPERPMRFADFHEPTPGDLALLAEEGLNLEAIHRAFYRTDDMERQASDLLGVVGRTDRFDGLFSPVEASLLECGAAFCPCPVCGLVAASDQAFPLRQNELHFITAHRFVCHGEFYLLKTLPVIVGLYLPDRELFVNARPRVESMRYMFFEAHQIKAVLHRFRLQCLRRPEAALAYASGGPKRRLLLFGNYYNLGHYIRNELAGLQSLLDTGIARELEGALVTLADRFRASELFPEMPQLAQASSLAAMDRDRQAFEAFKAVVDGHWLPVMVHFGGDFQESLAARMSDQARARSSQRAHELAARVRRGSPSVWVTLRSTRAWRGQEEGLARLLTRLHAHHPGLCAVFDGLENERGRLQAIRALLPEGLDVVDALGLDPSETITLAGSVDVHVSPLGTGATFLGIVNRPGVFHGSREIMDAYLLPAGEGSVASLPRENPALNLAVRAVREDEQAEMHVRGYELDVDELYQALTAVLERAGFGGSS